jgi:DNA polymerase
VFKSGKDIYCHAAEGIYGYPVDPDKHKDERQVGKVSELALGYQGGIGAAAQMARGYGVDFELVFDNLWSVADPEQRERAKENYSQYKKRAAVPVSEKFGIAADITKQRWRMNRPLTVNLWSDINDCAMRAVDNPGTQFSTPNGKLTYLKKGSFLLCRLPSKRCITYPYPKVVEKQTPWGTTQRALQYKGVHSLTKKWVEHDFYGGLGAENVTQAAARDLLAEAMVRMTRAQFDIVFHVHDEIVAEVREGKFSLSYFEKIMSARLPWAAGLPIGAAGWFGKRYKKA